ncbi:MAG: hypothetical protein K2Z81_24065 [Cyanobacteria bacterium]|nr:hypothetical protein [Cyanobacteriota bacterium]
MAQQRGMKRAEKVLKRTRKVKRNHREANLRRLERALEADDAQESEANKK